MTNTATFVMGVPWEPKRTKMAVELAQEAGAMIIWDRVHSGFDTWKRVLEAAGDAPMIVLEDDVALAPEWRELIELAIAERPGDVIQFFSMEPRDLELGSRYRLGKSFFMNQCTYLPAGYARDLREWIGDRELKNWVKLHDNILGQWLQERDERFYVHVPSLVQHRVVPSVSAKRKHDRRSPSFNAIFGDTR
jgi:hypothetical protein